MKSNFDLMIKVLVIGESGVGKTCLIRRFSDGTFSDNYLATIAVDFKTQIVRVKGSRVKIQIWDTAGQEKFHTLTTSFFKQTQGVLLCFSLTDRGSFEKVGMWMEQIREQAPDDVQLVLVGNKSDLKGQQAIPDEEIREFADNFGITYFRTSAFTGDNVDDAFRQLTANVADTLL